MVKEIEYCPYCHDYSGRIWSLPAYKKIMSDFGFKKNAIKDIRYCQWCGRKL